MRTDIERALVAAGFMLCIGASLSLAQSEQAAPAATFAPAAPHEALMEWHERAFKELNEQIAAKKESKASENAWLLAELANVNSFHRPDAKYRELATQLKSLAVETATVLKRKDLPAAQQLTKKLEATCTACHDAFGG